MRSLVLAAALIAVTSGCGDNNKQATPADARPADAKPDAPPDANPSDLIGAARMAADGAVMLPIENAIVTYLKPQIGSTTNDPAGFTIQAQQSGPALFVAVDPATTTPPLVKGDVVSFTITMVGTTGGQKRALAIADLTRVSQNANVAMLAQEVSSATDLVTAIDNYDSELIDVSATIAADFATSGSGFEKATINTTGITGNTSLVLRVPSTLRDAIDMVNTCAVAVNDTPVGRFGAETQLAAFSASDVTLTGCPAPTVVSAIALSDTSVRITFSRHVFEGSVMADGSQFTFDNGLTASAATVSGRTVTVTTSAQTPNTAYTVTVAGTVTDLQHTALGTPASAGFDGFTTPAVVRLNEINAHMGSSTNQCDLIELRVVSGGSMTGITIKERDVTVFTFGNLAVATNDILVLHFASANTTCNPGGPVNETSITGQAQATFSNNYDTAFDLMTTDSGLTDTDNVITVIDRFSTISDVILIDNNDNTAAAASETAAALAAAANQWQKVGGGVPAGGFVDADFTAWAVINSQTTGTTKTGDTLRRVDDTDDNDKDDWAQGAQTWGLINAGQTPF